MAETPSCQFQRLTIESKEPKAGFSMRVAIWTNDGAHVAIGAPSLAALEDVWKQITGTGLDVRRAQHVIVTKCDVPDEMFAQAQAAVREPQEPPR